MESVFGEVMSVFGEVISSYPTEDAIDDGCLVHPFPERFPWLLLTASVHASIEAADHGRTYEQKAIPLMMDAAMIVRKRPGGRLWTRGLLGNVTGGEVWIQRNDKGGLTLMHPEDY